MARGKQHLKGATAGRRQPARGTAPAPARGPVPPQARDAQISVLAGALAIVAFGLAMLARPGTIPKVAGSWSAIAVAVLAIGVAVVGWARGDRRRRERLPVLAPAALGATAIATALGVLVGGGIALALSIVIGIASAGLLGVAISLRRNR